MARSILTFPLVALAFVVELLRQLPGAGRVGRHTTLIAACLMLAALVALGVWMAQRSPQAASMADLAAGKLSHFQSWIVVSGELRAEPSSTDDYRYTLTDPRVPDAVLRVVSEVELPVGQTTVSGILLGGDAPAQVGYGWAGQLHADRVLAHEPDPPWVAIGLMAAALLVVVGHRTSYPMFVGQAPSVTTPRQLRLPVGVRSEWPERNEVAPGSFEWQRGSPVELRIADAETLRLRLHSAHSGAEVGELRRLFDSTPALIVRPSTGDLAITFASSEDRDVAFAAMVADVEDRRDMARADAARSPGT